jgi:purine-binding chemotaxis protein CheW
MLSDRPSRMLVFRVGEERFALPLGAVNEVVDMPAVQRLPDSSPKILGIATLRGELVSIYDPRPLLSAGGAAYDMVLLFATDNHRIGLAIDDVYDPIFIDADEVRSAPGVDASDGLLLGVVRRGTELIGLLDQDALMRALAAGDDVGSNADGAERAHDTSKQRE